MFRDRDEAGDRLADELERMTLARPLVLALPRGGVPVALPVARRLRAPLELVLVRKIGVPGRDELAAGAMMSGPGGEEIVFNDEVMQMFGLSEADLQATIARRRAQIAERREKYLGGRAPLPMSGRSLVIVDDGIATGMTVQAALAGLRRQDPARIVLAVPVAPRDTLARLRPMVDSLVCLETPAPFFAVGQQYRSFDQVDDDAVIDALERARSAAGNQTEEEDE